MRWFIEETGSPGETTLVITVTKREQRWLRAGRSVGTSGESVVHASDSDDFLYDLLESMFTNDCFTWLPEEPRAI